jgi:hypothetical protein
MCKLCHSTKVHICHLTLVPWYSDGLIELLDSSNLQNKLKMFIENDGPCTVKKQNICIINSSKLSNY